MSDLGDPGGSRGEAPDRPRVQAFWEVAKRHAKLTRMPGYFGPSAIESVPPPEVSLGFTRGEADDNLAELLATGRFVIEVGLADYAGEPLPEVGTLAIVLDGGEEPRALVATGAVEVIADRVVERLDLVFPKPQRATANRSSV